MDLSREIWVRAARFGSEPRDLDRNFGRSAVTNVDGYDCRRLRMSAGANVSGCECWQLRMSTITNVDGYECRPFWNECRRLCKWAESHVQRRNGVNCRRTRGGQVWPLRGRYLGLERQLATCASCNGIDCSGVTAMGAACSRYGRVYECRRVAGTGTMCDGNGYNV